MAASMSRSAPNPPFVDDPSHSSSWDGGGRRYDEVIYYSVPAPAPAHGVDGSGGYPAPNQQHQHQQQQQHQYYPPNLIPYPYYHHVPVQDNPSWHGNVNAATTSVAAAPSYYAASMPQQHGAPSPYGMYPPPNISSGHPHHPPYNTDVHMHYSSPSPSPAYLHATCASSYLTPSLGAHAHETYHMGVGGHYHGSENDGRGTTMKSGVGGVAAGLTPSGDATVDLKRALIFLRKNSANATLYSIQGFIADVAQDQEGSRFIQRRLKVGNHDEKRLALAAALPALKSLQNDAYGNFMLQGLLEHGTSDMRKELKKSIKDEEVVSLSLHIYGCRVIQKALEFLDEEDVSEMIAKFHGEVLNFIHDPNGNHVIQKSIQAMSAFSKSAAVRGDLQQSATIASRLQFVIDDVVANVESLSQHRYGCRVVQRTLEYCIEEQRDAVLEEVILYHERLIDDQYGNYVIQQALHCGSEEWKGVIMDTLTKNDSLVKFSKHKYASNVIEAGLKHGSPNHIHQIVSLLLESDKDASTDSTDEEAHGSEESIVVEMAHDPIANYVIKSLIDVLPEGDEQRDRLFEELQSKRDHLETSPYAKYIIAKLNQKVKEDSAKLNQKVKEDSK